jgi:LytR cell envelope-related transcriptional attenuator
VTIPGLGDLSPPHHHVPIGRWLVTILVFALLAGGGYAAFLGLTGGSSGASASKLPLCPLPSTLPAPPAGPLRLTVKNATERNGLAASVAAQLTHRAFHVISIGNAIKISSNVATVRYSRDRRLGADKVAAQITGSTLVEVGGHGVVELDIGTKFQALATPLAAKSAYLRLLPHPAVTPAASPTCRPQD